MLPHVNEEDLLACLKFVSRSMEDASSFGSLGDDDDEEPWLLIQEPMPLLQLLENFVNKREASRNEDSPGASTALEPLIALEDLASSRDCREHAADVLNEIQALVASEIQTLKKHCGCCLALEKASVARAQESIEMEKDIVQEYEKIQGQAESCFNNIRLKTDGKLLLPHEKQMAELLDKNRKLETCLKEKEDIMEKLLKQKEDRERATLGQFEGIFLEEVVGAFGASAWNKYFGHVGDEPPLPPKIVETMESPCPFWTGKKTRETHLLVLIPATVNGQPFSLDLLQTLIQTPKSGGNKTSYQYFHDAVKNEIGSKAVKRSYWILITRELLPNSTNKTQNEQEKLIASYGQERTGMDYKHPIILEATTAVLANFVRTGVCLVGDGVWIRGEERVNGSCRPLVGYFGTFGIDINCHEDVAHCNTGVLACCAWEQD